MSKIDLKKEFKQLYSASAKKPFIVEVPRLKFLMWDGAGHPADNPAMQDSLGCLYGVAYTLKFQSKLGPTGRDWTIMPPEGLWWVMGNRCFSVEHKADWRWTMMMLVPDFVTAKMVRGAVSELREKKDTPGLEKLRLESYREGRSVQFLHIGPYDQEQETIARMQAHAAENGYSFAGKHHEIYLSDPRRTAPEKLKTILRHPVKKIGR